MVISPWQLHDNQLSSLPGALGELQMLFQLRLRYAHVQICTHTRTQTLGLVIVWTLHKSDPIHIIYPVFNYAWFWFFGQLFHFDL